MDGAGEYNTKLIPKNQRLNVFSVKWMLIHNGEGVLGAKGRMGELWRCVEGNEGRGQGKERWWNETNIITLCTCMIT